MNVSLQKGSSQNGPLPEWPTSKMTRRSKRPTKCVLERPIFKTLYRSKYPNVEIDAVSSLDVMLIKHPSSVGTVISCH